MEMPSQAVAYTSHSLPFLPLNLLTYIWVKKYPLYLLESLLTIIFRHDIVRLMSHASKTEDTFLKLPGFTTIFLAQSDAD